MYNAIYTPTHTYIYIFCKYLIMILNIKTGINYFSQWKWKLFSHISATPWTIQSVEFSRPEYWSGQPFPSPGGLPSPGIEPVRGRSTLRDPICYFLPLHAIPQGLSVPYQLLENRNEQNCTQFSGLKSWERAPAWIPFSDSLQWPFT